jgi:ABC-type phosphate/phosphonate transport system permease subunit
MTDLGAGKIRPFVGGAGTCWRRWYRSTFDLFQYKNTSSIILMIFGIVLVMEFLTDRLRARVQ